MEPSPVTCEIVELSEELSSVRHLKEAKPSGCVAMVDNRVEKFRMQNLANKYSLEDDINKLFEEIELRASAQGFRSARQLSKDSLRKSALKKSIRGGGSQASGIGISQSATLKQALRGLCISHASEMAAMKRLSKSMVGSSEVSEAGAIKRLYRAVVIEANDSGLPPDEGKGSLVEISLVPEKGQINSSKKIPREKSLRSSAHDSSEVAVTANATVERPNSCSRTAQQNNVVSAFIETEKKKAVLKFGKNLKLNFSSSLLSSRVDNKANESISKANESISNCPSVVKPVRKNKCFLNKKTKNEKALACTSSNTCSADEKSDMSTCTSNLFLETHGGNQNATKESPLALSSSCLDIKVISDGCRKRNFDANSSECSRSRGPVDFSQSSISSIGEYSNSTCISEDSHSYRSTCTGSRPHMSNDSRWGAIRHVETRYGKLALRHFKLLKRLGCGDLGTVYLAELTGTDCLFAVKVMDTDSLVGKKKTSRAQTEREILQMLDHPFLPTLYAHFTTNKFSILIMEYCPGGDLHVLRQKQPGQTFTEQEARFYVAEVLLALEYLHMLGIVYRDLKPENILVREDGHIMLCDFDLSLRCTVQPTLVKTSAPIVAPTKWISHPCMESSCIDPSCLQPSCVVPCFTHRSMSSSAKSQLLKSNVVAQVPQLLAEPTSARSNSFVGTHEYLAPEIIRGEGHGNAVDWWTFGIFLYEILFGTTPFKGSGNDETLANAVMHRIKFPETASVSSQAKDLIKGLLIKEPQYRFGSVKGAAEIRQHPFFEGLNWALIRCIIPPILPESGDTEIGLLASEECKLVEYKKTADDHLEFDLF